MHIYKKGSVDLGATTRAATLGTHWVCTHTHHHKRKHYHTAHVHVLRYLSLDSLEKRARLLRYGGNVGRNAPWAWRRWPLLIPRWCRHMRQQVPPDHQASPERVQVRDMCGERVGRPGRIHGPGREICYKLLNLRGRGLRLLRRGLVVERLRLCGGLGAHPTRGTCRQPIQLTCTAVSPP